MKPERKEKHNILIKEKYHRLRRAAMAAYGNKCTCCNETEYDFLQLDHIEGGGTAFHKKTISYGAAYMIWLANQGYPDGLQVLCANCHYAKTRKVICPHKRK